MAGSQRDREGCERGNFKQRQDHQSPSKSESWLSQRIVSGKSIMRPLEKCRNAREGSKAGESDCLG